MHRWTLVKIRDVPLIPLAVINWALEELYHYWDTEPHYVLSDLLCPHPVTLPEYFRITATLIERTGLPWTIPLIDEIRAAARGRENEYPHLMWALDPSRSWIGFCPLKDARELAEDWFTQTEKYVAPRFYAYAVRVVRVPKKK